MKILVTGCLHGDWELLYDTYVEIIQNGDYIDFIIVTGDSQTFRFEEDLESFTAPKKYHLLKTFPKIFFEEKKFPIPVIIVGGNHESSDIFHLLPFGGWICPNIYFTGKSNYLRIGDISLASLSGIYKSNEYFEPINENYPIRSIRDKHSTNNIRAFSDFQLMHLNYTDIMISHDWPKTIPKNFGGNYLNKIRPDLIESDKKDQFGLIKGFDLLTKLKPKYWFASHHHLRFNIKIENTNFLALSKPIKKNWFEIINLNGNMGEIKYIGEWISILKNTKNEMINPLLLKDINWIELINQKNIEKINDQDLIEFNSDYIQQTISFCKKFEIYCPVNFIRELIN